MIPTTASALAIIFLGIVPGYVAIATYGARQKTWLPASGDLPLVLRSIVVSAILQIPVAWVTYLWLYPVREHLDLHPLRLGIWVAVVTLAMPWLGGLLWARLVNTLPSADAEPPSAMATRLIGWLVPKPSPPTMWDRLFASKLPEIGPCLVVVEFDDGRRVGGTFEDGSSALTTPDMQGLFLNREYVLNDDGDPIRERSGTRGVMIARVDGIRAVRVIT